MDLRAVVKEVGLFKIFNPGLSPSGLTEVSHGGQEARADKRWTPTLIGTDSKKRSDQEEGGQSPLEHVGPIPTAASDPDRFLTERN